jgi:hypothetical protein
MFIFRHFLNHYVLYSNEKKINMGFYISRGSILIYIQLFGTMRSEIISLEINFLVFYDVIDQLFT